MATAPWATASGVATSATCAVATAAAAAGRGALALALATAPTEEATAAGDHRTLDPSSVHGAT